MKTVNGAVDWSTNLHAVPNGGHGYSLENHQGALLRTLRSVIFVKREVDPESLIER